MIGQSADPFSGKKRFFLGGAGCRSAAWLIIARFMA
jgi:hypothetical protein